MDIIFFGSSEVMTSDTNFNFFEELPEDVRNMIASKIETINFFLTNKIYYSSIFYETTILKYPITPLEFYSYLESLSFDKQIPLKIFNVRNGDCEIRRLTLERVPKNKLFYQGYRITCFGKSPISPRQVINVRGFLDSIMNYPEVILYDYETTKNILDRRISFKSHPQYAREYYISIINRMYHYYHHRLWILNDFMRLLPLRPKLEIKKLCTIMKKVSNMGAIDIIKKIIDMNINHIKNL